LIEEVARIHGYEAIPEDVGVPMVPSARRREDRVLERVRRVLCAAGFDEALTLSVTDDALSASMSPWTTAEPLRSEIPVIRGADRLRRCLVPSLLAVRRTNESLSNAEIELFEIARAYLPEQEKLPREDLLLAITSGRDYATVKGAVEATRRTFPCWTLRPRAVCGFAASGSATSADCGPRRSGNSIFAGKRRLRKFACSL
jgi:phenylalanyl-tRNA synthetase beta chain